MRFALKAYPVFFVLFGAVEIKPPLPQQLH